MKCNVLHPHKGDYRILFSWRKYDQNKQDEKPQENIKYITDTGPKSPEDPDTVYAYFFDLEPETKYEYYAALQKRNNLAGWYSIDAIDTPWPTFETEEAEPPEQGGPVPGFTLPLVGTMIGGTALYKYIREEDDSQ